MGERGREEEEEERRREEDEAAFRMGLTGPSRLLILGRPASGTHQSSIINQITRGGEEYDTKRRIAEPMPRR